jgi:hypothetical protein
MKQLAVVVVIAALLLIPAVTALTDYPHGYKDFIAYVNALLPDMDIEVSGLVADWANITNMTVFNQTVINLNVTGNADFTGYINATEQIRSGKEFVAGYDNQLVNLSNYGNTSKLLLTSWANHTTELGGLRGNPVPDCTVDVYDLAIVDSCFGCTLGQQCWNGCDIADVSGNNIVDIFDLAGVGVDWGYECPAAHNSFNMEIQNASGTYWESFGLTNVGNAFGISNNINRSLIKNIQGDMEFWSFGGDIILRTFNDGDLVMQSDGAIRPAYDAVMDFGDPNYRYRNMYLSDIAITQSTFIPYTNRTGYIGNASNMWGDGYFVNLSALYLHGDGSGLTGISADVNATPIAPTDGLFSGNVTIANDLDVTGNITSGGMPIYFTCGENAALDNANQEWSCGGNGETGQEVYIAEDMTLTDVGMDCNDNTGTANVSIRRNKAHDGCYLVHTNHHDSTTCHTEFNAGDWMQPFTVTDTGHSHCVITMRFITR